VYGVNGFGLTNDFQNNALVRRARDALRQCLPEALRTDQTFHNLLKDDQTIQRWLNQLLINLADTTSRHDGL
jgi:hypothetical protein